MKRPGQRQDLPPGEQAVAVGTALQQQQPNHQSFSGLSSSALPSYLRMPSAPSAAIPQLWIPSQPRFVFHMAVPPAVVTLACPLTIRFILVEPPRLGRRAAHEHLPQHVQYRRPTAYVLQSGSHRGGRASISLRAARVTLSISLNTYSLLLQ